MGGAWCRPGGTLVPHRGFIRLSNDMSKFDTASPGVARLEYAVESRCSHGYQVEAGGGDSEEEELAFAPETGQASHYSGQPR